MVFAVQFLTAQSAFRLEKNQKSDVVFSGVENPIVVKISGTSNQSLQITPSFGETRRDSAGNFLWKICHMDSSWATLIIKDLAKNKNLDTVIFKVKMIPPPKIQVGYKPLENPPKGIICGRGGSAWATVENFPLEVACEILQFEVTYYSKDGDPVDRINRGARFNVEVQEFCNKAKPGDRYTFRKFQYRCGCDETVRRQYDEPIKITIK